MSLGLVDGGDGVADALAGGEIEGDGDDRELALVVDDEGALALLKVGEGGERDLGAVGALDVDIVERGGIALELGRDLEDDVVLVQLGEDGGDLALAEGIVEGVVDVLRGDAEARGRCRDR